MSAGEVCAEGRCGGPGGWHGIEPNEIEVRRTDLENRGDGDAAGIRGGAEPTQPGSLPGEVADRRVGAGLAEGRHTGRVCRDGREVPWGPLLGLVWGAVPDVRS